MSHETHYVKGSNHEGAYFRGVSISTPRSFRVETAFCIDPRVVKASLWDFDHTIGDFEILHRRACVKAVRSLLGRAQSEYAKKGIPACTWRQKFSLGFGKPTSETNQIMTDESLALLSDDEKNILNQRLNNNLSESMYGKTDICFLTEKALSFLERKREEKFTTHLGEWIETYRLTLNPGVEERLKELKDNDIRLGLVTSSKRSFVEPVLKYFNIHDLFDTFVYQDDPALLEAKKWKPDPLPYIIAMKRLEVKPENTLGHEDSMTGALALARAEIGYKLIVPANNNSFFRSFNDQPLQQEILALTQKSNSPLIVLPERIGWQSVQILKASA